VNIDATVGFSKGEVGMHRKYFGIWILVAVAALAGIFSYLEIGVEQDGEPGAVATLQNPGRLLGIGKAVDVFIASAVTKQGWLEAAVREFQKAGITTSDGAKIRFQVDPVLSGGSMRDILSGKIEPVA